MEPRASKKVDTDNYIDLLFSDGHRYFRQQRYFEAEQIFRQVLQRQENALGENAETLSNMYWLAQSVYKQKKHDEAAQLFRQVSQGREKVLGKEHVDTLRSTIWLAQSLHNQEEYFEAEQVYKRLIPRQERVLGKEHADTLMAKHWLALSLYVQDKYNMAEPIFQETVQGREKVLGEEHIDTLRSKYLLAVLLYEQTQYHTAEQLFEQAVKGRESALGKEHVATLNSKQGLAQSLHEQKRYSEAEQIFQQVVEGREEVLGKEDIDTLTSKHWLAVSCYNQERYPEAEKVFRQVLLGQEKVLGEKDVEALSTKHWLALSLYKQKRFEKAEQIFQQAVQEREEVLGKEHVDTLISKHWLAKSWYDQKRYSGAEHLLHQVVRTREKTMGKDNIHTLGSKFWLARSVYEQERYPEAEIVFQQMVEGQSKTYGPRDVMTLESKHWLAATLYKQQRYAEAEQLLREVLQGREKVLGVGHQDVKDSKDLLQTILEATASTSGENKGTETAGLGRLHDFFQERQAGNAKFTDQEINQISSLLRHSHPRWSRVPRTYIILRTVGCLNLLDDFINLGFSDYWFPVTERNLPECLHASHRSEFVAVQEVVLTKSIGLEKGDGGQHAQFRRGEALPFEERGILGSGGFGQVDKVLSLISFKEYARKRVSRKQAFGGRGTEAMKQFVAEIAILKRLKHCHVVELLGSYTDPKYIGLIMSPVADIDLSTYLLQADSSKCGELRTFFGCLARGLEFLHGEKVRHKDIKPGNVLVRKGKVLFTDFGLSADFTDADGSTTCGMVNGMTPRYCAPEVALFEPRNTASDIWSLGVVFLEMAAVLKGKLTEFVPDFLKRHGSKQAFVRSNPTALPELIATLRASGQALDDCALEWPRRMLQVEQQHRPTANTLIASIITAGPAADRSGIFCGICCTSLDDEFSDVSDDSEDNA